MRYLGLLILSVALFFAFGFTTEQRPSLPDCGELLPADHHYGLDLTADWNTSINPATGNMSMTLTDLATGEKPREIPPELEPFRSCALSAIGLQ